MIIMALANYNEILLSAKNADVCKIKAKLAKILTNDFYRIIQTLFFSIVFFCGQPNFQMFTRIKNAVKVDGKLL